MHYTHENKYSHTYVQYIDDTRSHCTIHFVFVMYWKEMTHSTMNNLPCMRVRLFVCLCVCLVLVARLKTTRTHTRRGREKARHTTINTMERKDFVRNCIHHNPNEKEQIYCVWCKCVTFHVCMCFNAWIAFQLETFNQRMCWYRLLAIVCYIFDCCSVSCFLFFFVLYLLNMLRSSLFLDIISINTGHERQKWNNRQLICARVLGVCRTLSRCCACWYVFICWDSNWINIYIVEVRYRLAINDWYKLHV